QAEEGFGDRVARHQVEGQNAYDQEAEGPVDAQVDARDLSYVQRFRHIIPRGFCYVSGLRFRHPPQLRLRFGGRSSPVQKLGVFKRSGPGYAPPGSRRAADVASSWSLPRSRFSTSFCVLQLALLLPVSYAPPT